MKERREFARFQQNIESVIKKNTKEPHYEEIPDAPEPFSSFQLQMPQHFRPLFEKPSGAQGPSEVPPGRQSFHNVLFPPNVEETSSNLKTPPSSQVGGTGFSTDSGVPEWSGLSFLGPRFPSLERDEGSDPVSRSSENLIHRIADKKKIESLRELTETQLQEITSLEGRIHRVPK